MGEFTADWPDDADGGVFRSLAAAGFDFQKSWVVDYNVDSERWPPSEAAKELLGALYGDLTLYPPEEDGAGYIQFQLTGPVTYEGVISIQLRASAAMRPHGGICESWGLLHDAV